MIPADKIEFHVRGMEPSLALQLESHAKKMGISKNQLAKIILENEMKESLMRTELNEMAELSHQVELLNKTVLDHIERTNQLIDIYRSPM